MGGAILHREEQNFRVTTDSPSETVRVRRWLSHIFKQLKGKKPVSIEFCTELKCLFTKEGKIKGF